jgi:hypothetical protein
VFAARYGQGRHAEENAALRAQLCEAKAARYGFAPLGTQNPAFAR